MEKVTMQISRPNFFPGQMIDWKDFNRLASQADKVSALLCRHVFQGGGIIVNALDEFRIEPLKGLAVIVKPGLAMLPSGYPVILSKDCVVDLSEYRKGDSQVLVVSLKSSVEGKDKYVDKQDGSISGYLTESIESAIVVSSGQPVADGVELFRVTLESDLDSLRMPSVSEEWSAVLESGVVDLRSRKRIVPQTYAPLTFNDLLSLRESLYAIEQAHKRLQRLYLCEDPFATATFLSALHAEALSLPFQPLKVAFLAAEFADKLSLFLEKLVQHASRGDNEIDQTALMALVRLLESQKIKAVLPKTPDLSFLNETAKALMGLVEFGEKNFRLVHIIEEALRETENREFQFGNEALLAGHVFSRTDLVKADQEDRYQTKTTRGFQRSLTTRYANGDQMTLTGKFIRDGVVEIPIEIKDENSPAVCILRQYVRRAGTVVHYEVNGQLIGTESWEDSDLSNAWRNKGLVIPAEKLTSQGNTLRIRLDRSDLDFGFFEVAVFQPEVVREDAA